MRRGFVFGKYYPFHVGHEALINFARKQCDELIVIVCASDKEKIPEQKRVEWIEKTYKQDPGIRVIGLSYSEDELVNTSVASREVSRAWAERFKKILDPVDLVVTAEPYGDYVAEYMGISHVPYLAPKKISATEIRRDIFKHWGSINYYARLDLVKKVAVLGTESTGKSTLAAKLAKEFETEFVPEVGREILKGKTTDDCTSSDLREIAEAHAAEVAKKIPQARRLLFLDTDLHITQSYSRFLFDQELEVTNEMIEASKADLSLYLDKDVPFVQDGTRLNQVRRDALDLSHQKVLEEAGIECRHLTGTFDERYSEAVKLVRELVPSGL